MRALEEACAGLLGPEDNRPPGCPCGTRVPVAPLRGFPAGRTARAAKVQWPVGNMMGPDSAGWPRPLVCLAAGAHATAAPAGGFRNAVSRNAGQAIFWPSPPGWYPGSQKESRRSLATPDGLAAISPKWEIATASQPPAKGHVQLRNQSAGPCQQVRRQSLDLGAAQDRDHPLGEKRDRFGAALVDGAPQDRQDVAGAAGAALLDDLLGDLARRAGDVLVRMH